MLSCKYQKSLRSYIHGDIIAVMSFSVHKSTFWFEEKRIISGIGRICNISCKVEFMGISVRKKQYWFTFN